MGSKSQASNSSADSTTSTALSRDNVMQSGQMISESVIIDPSDTTMLALVSSFKSQFETLVASNRASTAEFQKLGQSVLDMADRNQIRMTDFGYKSLQTSVDFMTAQLEAGRYMIDFNAGLADQSYNLANKVVGNQSDAVDRAFGILSDVKTGDYSETLKSLTGSIMIFALLALYISLRARK